MRKSLYVSAVLSACVLSARAAEEWRAARGLTERPGVESVRARVDRATAEAIELTYSMPRARAVGTARAVAGAPASRVEMGNAPVSGRVGRPRLPVVPAKILLPAGRELVRVEAVPGRRVALAGRHAVEHGEKPYPIGADRKPPERGAEPDRAVYGSDDAYPRASFEVVGVQKQRGASILFVNLHPVEYHPRSGRLTYAETMSVRVITRPAGARDQVSVRRPLRPLADTVDNPGAAATYEAGPADGPAPLGICDPADTYAYVIVTSEAIKNASDPYAITNLLAHKKARGLTGTIVTMETITNNYTGTDHAERLRNFILDAYNNWETDYVLLGGDTGVVPMRKLWCQAYAGGDIDHLPSDVYFQCLDGNYNSDGDANWGEPTDGPGGADVDLLAEVYIGRASAETPAEMANFVYKTIAYENESETADYLRSALMCGEHLGFGGVAEYATESMEEIRLGSDAHGYTTAGFAESELFTVGTLYDAPGYSWPKAEILDRINSGQFSIINHLGHANYNYVMKFYNADADALTNTTFLFAYSQGCIPGNFEADCVAEHLTTSTRHGMFAVVFNSRYGWGTYNSTDGPSQRFDRQFWDAYFGEKIVPIGALNADSHEDNLWDINGECIRWCFYESNLLGDPQTPMRGQFLSDAIVLSPPSGLSSRGAEGGPFVPGSQSYYLFSTATNDPLDWSAASTQAWVTIEPAGGTLAPGEHASFTVSVNTNAAPLPEGRYLDTLVFTNTSTGKGSTTREIRLVVSNPPRITNTSVQAGGVMPAGDLGCRFDFNEPMSFTNLDAGDFSLVGAISGPIAAAGWMVALPGQDSVTIQYNGLAEDRYTMTLRSGDGAFEDLEGTDLDGEALAWPIPPNRSGDGIEGGDFACTFDVDATTVALPLPLTPVLPRGSLIYESRVAAYIAPALDDDRFTIALDAGQTLAAVVDPDATLRPEIRLFDPFGALLGSTNAAGDGQVAVLQPVAVAVPGTYAVEISGLGASTGRYELAVLLNAAVEAEEHDGATNDGQVRAEDINPSFIVLPEGVRRAAVLGRAERGGLVTLYEEDFESGLNGFTTNNSWGSGRGMWHLSSGRMNDAGHSPTSSLYYGQGEGPNGGGSYTNGYPNGGLVMSPPISLPADTRPTLAFRYFLETEGSPSWDVCTVRATNSAGTAILLSSAAGTLPTGSSGQWITAYADLAAYAGTNVALQFTFDTGDAILNQYEGWYVDDLLITAYSNGTPDWYSFSLASGEVVSLLLTGFGDDAMTLGFYNGSRELLATGAGGAANVKRLIEGCAVTNSGRYWARVTGVDEEYSLVVLCGAGFDLEPNGDVGSPQEAGTEAIRLGHIVAGGAPIAQETEPNDDGVVGCTTNDFLKANDWSGSFTAIGGNQYRASLTGTIASGSDVDWDFFRIAAGPGDSILVALDGGSLYDPYLRLYDRNGTLIASDDDGGAGYNALLSYASFAYEGEYYVVADSWGSYAGSYTLTATWTTLSPSRALDRDLYGFDLAAGSVLSIRTWTPGDGTNQFANDLDPIVDVYGPDGLLLGSDDNGAPDGRNACWSNMVWQSGRYVAGVRSAQGGGEYLARMDVVQGPTAVAFGSALITAYETNAATVLPVCLAPATTSVVTVQYRVCGGTATRGEDYLLADGTLTFEPGQTRTDLVIQVLDDVLFEGTETIELELFGAIHAEIGFVSNCLCRIRDDELPMQVRFSTVNYAAAENAGTAVVVAVRLGGSDGDIRVSYRTSNGTARAGYDYTAVTGLLYFADGVATQTFGVPILWDYRAEGNETVLLYLHNPTGGVVLGAVSNATLTITDVFRPLADLLVNPGFEATPGFAESGWTLWGPGGLADWGAHSGQRGGYLEGWSPYTSAQLFQDVVGLPAGTYTFALWIRQEESFCPTTTYLELDWLDGNGAYLGITSRNVRLPSDGRWHPVYVTGSCASTNLASVRALFYSSWATNRGGPSAVLFDDACFYVGSYTGIPELANGGFESGVGTGWRGSQWWALPEGVANGRETWARRSGSWGVAMKGYETVSNHYTTVVGQCLVPGTGTYTFTAWVLRDAQFAFSGGVMRLEWYDATYTNKVRPDSERAFFAPNDGAWREVYVDGSCADPNLFELRAVIETRYSPSSTDPRALKIDDARLVRGRPDTDGDGLPDAWESAFFGGITNADAATDSDGDGDSNTDEYAADTDPLDPDSCFRLGILEEDAPDRHLQFPCSVERAYDVLFSSDLVHGPWACLRTNVTGVGGLYELADTNAAPFRAYRVRARFP